MSTYKRIGPEAKCPACGWRLDLDAYRCPKCFIYFCYRCRKRVQKGDCQFQCVNQTCECHGKLLCSACTVMVPEFGDVTHEIPVTEPKNGRGEYVGWPTGIIGGMTFFIAGPEAALAIASIVFVVGLIILKALRLPFHYQPSTYTNQITNEKIRDHRCCIQCRKPVEVLR